MLSAVQGQPPHRPISSASIEENSAGSTGKPTHGEPAGKSDDEIDDLLNFSLESLSSTQVATPDMNFEVTSVARDETPIGKSPAAIFVITPEMIQRSGAQTLPDVLRMVPGMHVARQSNGVFAIGMRGHAATVVGDMLVQVDGRSIYNRTFGGTFWGSQDFVLEDIERIEVIRGPGASVWGANAVRGIINVVTKCSCRTQGWYLESVVGDEIRHSETIRYGGKARWGHYRIWGRGYDQDGGALLSGANDPGFWETWSAGFQADITESWFDRLTLQAGVLDGSQANTSSVLQPAPPFAALTNATADTLSWFSNIQGTRKLSPNESIKLRTSYYSLRFDSATVRLDPIDAVEFDFQHNLQPWTDHSVVWGFNFRNTMLDLVPTFPISATGDSDLQANEYGLFLQDTISLREDVSLTVGAKLSYNDFSQFEHQPTGRIVWSPSNKLSIWTGVSRAVATPNFSGIAGQIRLPSGGVTPPGVFPRFVGNRNLSAEDLLAVEAGIRGQPNKQTYWDFSAYHFTFRDQIGAGAFGAPVPTGFPGTFDVPFPRVNLPGTTEVAGFEMFGKYEVQRNWRMSGNYTFAHNFDPGFAFPRNSIYVQSSHDIACNVELDLIWRYRDNFGAIRHYNTADARISWRMTDHASLSLVGRNLLNPAHAENSNLVQTGTFASAAERSLFGMLQLRY